MGPAWALFRSKPGTRTRIRNPEPETRTQWAVSNNIIFGFLLNSDINKELIKFKQVNLIRLSEVGIKREEVSNLILQV